MATESGELKELTNTADVFYVREVVVGGTLIEERLEGGGTEQAFASCDWETRVSSDGYGALRTVLVGNRVLEPTQIKRLEGTSDLECGVHVKAPMAVNEDSHAGTDSCSDGGDTVDTRLGELATVSR